MNICPSPLLAPVRRPVLMAVMSIAMLAMTTALLSNAAQAQTSPSGSGAKTAPSTIGTKPPAATRRESGVPGHYDKREEVQAFIKMMAERHRYDPETLQKTFAAVRKQPDVLRLIAPPSRTYKRSWENYRTRFLDRTRINGGLEFMQQHRATLERAAQIYGVPVEVIVAIIGVETIYGRVTGSFRIIETLTTLTFDYPRRAEFFSGELEHFLVLTREAGIDPFEPRGSYAGASGLPQFMPGSIRRYAVDFDRDGRIDLQGSVADSIGSVARYLAEHGWVPGGPVYYPTRIASEDKLQPLIDAGIEPRYTSGELSGFGVQAIGSVPDGTRMALIDLPNGDNPTTYLLGARNFYVVTRYNRSSFYATAVLELAEALKNGQAQ